MEFVSIDTWSLIFTWVNLLILFLIMKKLLFKPVMNMLKERDEEVKAMYENASAAQKTADAAKKEYTRKLADAKEEASKIVKEATENAAAASDKTIAEAKETAMAMIQKAESEIDRERKAAAASIKNDIAEISVSIARKVIEKDINEKDQERLIEEFIESSGGQS